MDIEDAEIPGAGPADRGYKAGQNYFLASRHRPRGAAASTFGVLMQLRAVTAAGEPVLRASGRQISADFTHSVPKAHLVDGTTTAEDVARVAFAGAAARLLEEIATEDANSALEM